MASSLCGACYDVCPVAIDIPTMLVHMRERVVDVKRGSRLPSGEQLAMAAAAWTMAKPSRWRRALGMARLGRRRPFARDGRITSLPGPLAAWTSARDLPVPPKESFRAWWSRTHGKGE